MCENFHNFFANIPSRIRQASLLDAALRKIRKKFTAFITVTACKKETLPTTKKDFSRYLAFSVFF